MEIIFNREKNVSETIITFEKPAFKVGRIILYSSLDTKDAIKQFCTGYMYFKTIFYDGNRELIGDIRNRLDLRHGLRSVHPIMYIDDFFRPQLKDVGFKIPEVKEWHTIFEVHNLNFNKGDRLELEIEY